MQTFTVTGKTLEECKTKAREKFGEGAMVMSQRVISSGGFLGFFPHEMIEATGWVQEIPDMSKYAFGIYNKKTTPLETAGTAAQNRLSAIPISGETEKDRILQRAAEATGTDPALQRVLIELKNLSDKIGEKSSSAAAFEHENIVRLNLLLEQNDFTYGYRKKIVERVRREIPLDDLDDFNKVSGKVLEWLAEGIAIYKADDLARPPRIIVLVGPTGVGKTTTIAKLAARFIVGDGETKKYSVGVITIDNYRLAAHQQLEQYAEILQIPFANPDDEASFKRELSIQSESVDIILIDTAGKSPRDSVQLAETKKLLELCGSRAEAHLTISASTKSADITEIMRQFEPFAYRSVIVTKLDETKQIGNVLSALAESGKPVSYITDGQESTNETVKQADVRQLLTHVEGF